MGSEGCGEPHLPASTHFPPDVAFPYLTTNITRGGITDEYRAETEPGYVALDDPRHGFRQAPSQLCIPPDGFVLRDRERGPVVKKLVTWEEKDSENPWNWGKATRWRKQKLPAAPVTRPNLIDITAVVSTAVIQVTTSSAIATGDFDDQERHFGVSPEVIALTVTLVVCGFG